MHKSQNHLLVQTSSKEQISKNKRKTTFKQTKIYFRQMEMCIKYQCEACWGIVFVLFENYALEFHGPWITWTLMTVSLIKFHFIIYKIRQIFSLTTLVVGGVQDFWGWSIRCKNIFGLEEQVSCRINHWTSLFSVKITIGLTTLIGNCARRSISILHLAILTLSKTSIQISFVSRVVSPDIVSI